MISRGNKLNFPKDLFRDYNYETLHAEKHSRDIIEGVLTKGCLEDWYVLKDYYGIEKIKNEVVLIRGLDPVTLQFCSNVLDIPFEEFRTYLFMNSVPAYWLWFSIFMSREFFEKKILFNPNFKRTGDSDNLYSIIPELSDELIPKPTEEFNWDLPPEKQRIKKYHLC